VAGAAAKWQFWIDRGGTFTDIVARRPDGALASAKLLSDNPQQYDDAALAGIRRFLGLAAGAPLPAGRISAIKMGTTVATNALLERRGARCVLVITKGFADALRIATQNRPRLFDLDIRLPSLLYERVIEVDERLAANGAVLRPLDLAAARRELQAAYDAGIRAVAIVLMHGYAWPAHEQALAGLCRDIGFTQVSTGHQTSPLMKLVGRGDTTVVDAYLSPLLRRYVDRLSQAAGGVRLMFMQSNGGLTEAHHFQGKDAILSGPAGGVIGAIRTAARAGFEKIIGFDMGGTSTDVCHYNAARNNGELERVFESRVAGVRLRAPMMHIHTVAAGGGSILSFDGARFRVGPASAGARPGPLAYRAGGPLTVTDANLLLGRIDPASFPAVFGPKGDQPLDTAAVSEAFDKLASQIGSQASQAARAPCEVADGFLAVAIENMARAIKKISVQRGHDLADYTLVCFGGAGGQHACRLADALGMTRIMIHPLAGVLTALGMGLADIRALREQAVERELCDQTLARMEEIYAALGAAATAELRDQGVAKDAISLIRRAHLRYRGTDSTLVVPHGSLSTLREAFEAAHHQRYGFVTPERALIVEAVSLEAVGGGEEAGFTLDAPQGPARPRKTTRFYSQGRWHDAPVYARADLPAGFVCHGPAMLTEDHGVTILEAGWRAEVTDQLDLVLTRAAPPARRPAVGTAVDPVMLEIFNNLFMSIAEQMGVVLQNTARSVNMKERLDFSCALFDAGGQLIANAPHIPVHLGSMSQSVQTVIAGNEVLKPGDVFVLNAPYNGGTHLPDITVVTPCFSGNAETPLFYVASRGHHADIGGVTPGSMPPFSTTLDEEGVLIDNVKLVDGGVFREAEMRALLASGRWPARDPDQVIADLKAQIAANEKGRRELAAMVDHFGLAVVRAYMRHVQDNAEEMVRRVIETLREGAFSLELDCGAIIRMAITIDRASRRARLDFSGTSAQQNNNFNAPLAVTRAAILYVFRCLVADDIPLNAGCLKPLDIIAPPGSLLNPQSPAAVVAGNVETSQCIVDALFGALGVMASSQGTMNNFTFGNERHQYYETLCGGAGAGATFDGASAVHSHMTNSRLTDPEVLESRYPVLVESFAIRRGSGGNGAHRGGDGVVRRIRFLEPMTAAILSNRRRIPPFGLAGGNSGAPGRNRVKRAGGTCEELEGCAQTIMAPGDVFIIETPGGGGFGKA
jgi:5-oxoprolinase (ATP-hydrolysing)